MRELAQLIQLLEVRKHRRMKAENALHRANAVMYDAHHTLESRKQAYVSALNRAASYRQQRYQALVGQSVDNHDLADIKIAVESMIVQAQDIQRTVDTARAELEQAIHSVADSKKAFFDADRRVEKLNAFILEERKAVIREREWKEEASE